jgi:plasmid replication initiation protein
MKINNKDVVQSYVITTAKYDYSIYQKRILYRIVEAFQGFTKGHPLEGKIHIQKDLFGDYNIKMPLAAFLGTERDNNYEQAKKALRDLEKKSFEYEDDREWQIIHIINEPKIEKYSNNVTFRLNPRICEALLDFSKGFKKYELKTALSFNSIYSMRLYELLSGQKKPISYLIQNLKIMFKVEDKYKLTADFIRKTIDVAQKELDEKSPYSFIYKPNKNGKKIDSITFYPVYKPENRDPELDKKELQKKASISWDLEKMSIDYLVQNFGFTEKEIKNNIDLLKMAQKELDLVYELSKLKVKAETVKSPQAFVIGCIKKLLKA